MLDIEIRNLNEGAIEEIVMLHRDVLLISKDELQHEFNLPETFRWSGAFDGYGTLLATHRRVRIGAHEFLRMIYVKNSARHRGIGKKLTRFSIDTAFADHCHSVIAWSWDASNERQMLSESFSMAPGAERFLRFRVPRLERQPNDLFVRPARATDLPLIAEFCRKDAIGLMGMPDVQACGEVSTISGYAVWGTEAGILGGFYYACEGKYLSVLEPSFVGVPDYFKWLLAARLMALQNCSQVIDIPVPIHQIHMIFSIRAAGGLALHRSSIGLSQRIF